VWRDISGSCEKINNLTKTATGVICEIWVLPWAVIPVKAGIHPPAIENAPLTDWIPAFAGMTCVSKGIAFQMAPLPKDAKAQRPVRDNRFVFFAPLRLCVKCFR
jgi:hypothetical protein